MVMMIAHADPCDEFKGLVNRNFFELDEQGNAIGVKLRVSHVQLVMYNVDTDGTTPTGRRKRKREAHVMAFCLDPVSCEMFPSSGD